MTRLFWLLLIFAAFPAAIGGVVGYSLGKHAPCSDVESFDIHPVEPPQ